MVDRYNSYGRILEDIEPDGDAHFVRFDAYRDLAAALRNLQKETGGDDEAERAAARKLLELPAGWPHESVGAFKTPQEMFEDDMKRIASQSNPDSKQGER